MAATQGHQASSDGAVTSDSFFGAKESSQDQEKASAMALQQFFALSVAAGIQNLGVLLEILHVANYDAAKACRIVELVKGSPPTEPAIIATSPTSFSHGHGGTGTADQSCVQGSDCAVQAFGNGYVASAAAASPYSAAVVSCGPGSAGVGVGTSAGTTTSTAVPLSAVTSLPQNCVINLDFSQPAGIKCSTSPRKTEEIPRAAVQAPTQIPTQIPTPTRPALPADQAQEQRQAVVPQAMPSVPVKQNFLKKPSVATPLGPSAPKVVPSRPASKNPQEETVFPRQPSHIAPAADTVNRHQTVATPVLDEMDPLKVSKLQEIIDILKS